MQKDPFANIADLASGLNINFNPDKLSGKSPATTPLPSSPYGTQFPSPTHNSPQAQSQKIYHPAMTLPASSSPFHNHRKSPNGFIGKQGSSKNHATSTNNSTSQQSNLSSCAPIKPDYSRTNFEPKQSFSTSAAYSKNTDLFGDILGEQGYKFGSKINQGPRSINDMRKDDLVKDMDPDKLKIMEWVNIHFVFFLKIKFIILK